MVEHPERPTTPTCLYCGQLAQLVTGDAIYPHRPDLAHKYFWECAPCDAYVGCHAGTQRSLGVPARKELRRARNALHDQVIDPIWKSAPECGVYACAPGDERARKSIQRSAQPRVYRFLAHKLGLPLEETHVGMFTIEQCHAARTALEGVTYLEIRDWCKQQEDLAPEKRTVEPPVSKLAERGGMNSKQWKKHLRALRLGEEPAASDDGGKGSTEGA